MPSDRRRIDPKRPTNARNWCEHCRTFVYNNAISKANHEASPKHKERLQQTVQRIRNRAEQEERLLLEMERRSGVRILGDDKDKPVSSSYYHRQPGKGKEAPPLLGAPRKTTTASNIISNNTKEAMPGEWQPVEQQVPLKKQSPAKAKVSSSAESSVARTGKEKISFSLSSNSKKDN